MLQGSLNEPCINTDIYSSFKMNNHVKMLMQTIKKDNFMFRQRAKIFEGGPDFAHSYFYLPTTSLQSYLRAMSIIVDCFSMITFQECIFLPTNQDLSP